MDNNDIQKNRWGGKARGHGRRISVFNVDRRRRYFTFDVILESVDGSTLQGPVYFHLHDDYPQPKIRISKIQNQGRQAVLEVVESNSPFTIGVQFKDATGQWQSLEYDLAQFDGGSLQQYDD